MALAHDLGHPPFGHAGEEALQAQMRPYGGFDHNAQTLRVVTSWRRAMPSFDGLNLTWETLEGVVKHNGPWPTAGRAAWRASPSTTPHTAASSTTYASAEAQVAALADDIAYNNHDVDDGVRAGLFTPGGSCRRAADRRRTGGSRAPTYPDFDRGRIVRLRRCGG